MKKILLIALCVLFSFQLEASYYGRVYLGYTLMDQDYTQTDHGAHIGWLGALNITKDKLPLYFQYGLECVYAGASMDVVTNTPGDINCIVGEWEPEYDEGHENMFSMAIPLSLAYKIKAGKVELEPFVGPSVRFNIVGNVRYNGEKLFSYLDYDNTNSVQFGMNVGLGVNIKRFYVGYRFNPDFTPYYETPDKDYRTACHHVSVGWNF